jgi:hypothetical protein
MGWLEIKVKGSLGQLLYSRLGCYGDFSAFGSEMT